MQTETRLFRIIGEHFPDLMTKLIESWGRPDFARQIEDLTGGRRGGTAQALPGDILAALAELKQEHDRAFPHFGAQPAVHAPDTLAKNEHFQKINARFPHIGEQISRLWGKATFGTEINSLLNDTRAGARQGFPPEVALGLFSLLMDHEKEFPQHVIESKDIWSLSIKE